MPELNKKMECATVNVGNDIIISVLSNNVKSYIQEINFIKHHKPRRKKSCFLCSSQTNSLLLILGAYVVIFLIASVILTISVLKLQILSENEKFNIKIRTSENVHEVRYNAVLKPINNLLPQAFFKEFMWPYKSSLFNCSALGDVQKFNYLTSGWTKNVFSFEHGGRHYALKTVNVGGIDMKKCTERESNKVCLDKAMFKMYKEYILSRELSHSNIVQVLAWCVSSNNFTSNVAIVTELCSPIDLITLLRMSFHQRLKIMLDLSHLIAYLAESPLGSVAINDFQRQQFVLCGEILKLTDLDDLSIEEPKCSEYKHCHSKHEDANSTSKINVECLNNLCVGYNERQNVLNAYRHFVLLFLNISTPDVLKKDVETLFRSYTSGLPAKIVLKQTEFLYAKYNNLRNEIYGEKILNNFLNT